MRRRPAFIEHKGVRILRLDLSGLSPHGLVEAMERAKPVIAAEPPRSVRFLTVWKRNRLNAQVADAVKQFALHNTPFVRASALVGMTAIQASIVLLAIKRQGRRHLEVFEDEEAAKDWLAAR